MNPKDIAAYTTCFLAVCGAIGTYAVTKETVADLKIAQQQQIRSNQEVAERLARIETMMRMRVTSSAAPAWADREHADQ